MWRLKFLLAVCVVVAANPEGKDREKRWLNWAQLLGGEPPKPIETSLPVERTSENNLGGPYPRTQDKENAIQDQANKDYEDDHPDHYYAYEYEDSFFNNDYYEYVDTEDENYTPPTESTSEEKYVDTEDENYTPPTESTSEDKGEVSQDADRRTLDFFYHLFSDQFRTDQSNDGRPQRNTATTRRPSLIEAVFQTIDNHIVEDLQEWATYSAQKDAQAINTEKPLPLPLPKAKPSIGVPASIQQVSPDNNIVLVTDEQGNQHVVTINDIVSSLGELDEKTITNLLLGPPAAATSRSSLTNPSFNLDVAESQTVETQEPYVLGTQRQGQLGIQRPTRHTGPSTKTGGDDDEVYVVQDEKGEIKIVTINDIISSLAVLNDDGLNKLLFKDAAIPAIIPPATPKQVPTTTPRPTTVPKTTTTAKPKTSTPLPIPSAVTPKEESSSKNSTLRRPVPKVSTDFNGNIRVLAHPGSVTLDLQDSSWHTEEHQPKEAEPEKNKGPLVIDGSTIATDNKGNIHITPDPNRPFTLDIKNIIALAEQAETPNNAHKPTPSKTSKVTVKEETENKEKEDKPRGYEILSYLAGVEDFLPAAILPDPIRSGSPNTAVSQAANGQAEVNSFRTSLLDAIAQRQVLPTTTPQPPLLQRLVQPVIQPIFQPIVQAISQPLQQPTANGGLGATLSRLLSNFVGQSPTQQAVVVQQPQQKLPEEEFIKLVVRQQAPNSDDTHFGDITIPLPKPIHFQPTTTQAPAVETTTGQIAPRADIPSLLSRLSPLIQRSLLQQAENVPRFVPPGQSRVATQRSLSTASSRSDSGPIIRADTNYVNSRNNRIPVRPDIKPLPIFRHNVPPPITTTTTTTTQKPLRSVSQLLSGLPNTVLDSIRKQLQNARIGSSQEPTTEPPKTEVEVKEEVEEEPRRPTGQLDRSSYAHSHSPSYGSGGYGYGHGSTGSSNPLFDVYFLADLTNVHKVGDANLSFKSPIIGDPSYFVDTRPHHGYHR